MLCLNCLKSQIYFVYLSVRIKQLNGIAVEAYSPMRMYRATRSKSKRKNRVETLKNDHLMIKNHFCCQNICIYEFFFVTLQPNL